MACQLSRCEQLRSGIEPTLLDECVSKQGELVRPQEIERKVVSKCECQPRIGLPLRQSSRTIVNSCASGQGRTLSVGCTPSACSIYDPIEDCFGAPQFVAACERLGRNNEHDSVPQRRHVEATRKTAFSICGGLRGGAVPVRKLVRKRREQWLSVHRREIRQI